MAEWNYAYRDYDNEASSVGVPVADYTAANIDAQRAAAIALQAAMGAVLLGNLTSRTEVAVRAPQGVGKAADPNAQRESKALVQYYDDTTFRRFTMEMPCPNMNRQNPDYPGVFYLDGAANNNADWVTLVGLLEASLLADGNTAVVEKIIHVGRNI